MTDVEGRVKESADGLRARREKDDEAMRAMKERMAQEKQERKQENQRGDDE